MTHPIISSTERQTACFRTLSLEAFIPSSAGPLRDPVIPWNIVSNHGHLDCLPSRSFRRRSKKTSKLHVTGLCAANSPVIGEFPAQRASNAANVSISLRRCLTYDKGVVSYCYLRICNPVFTLVDQQRCSLHNGLSHLVWSLQRELCLFLALHNQ